jgi:hypothetical protein
MDMSKPLALQQQLEAADALRRQVYGEGDPPDDAPVTDDAGDDAPVGAARDGGGAGDVPQLAGGSGDASAGAPGDAPVIPAKPGHEEDAEYWKARASTLYGINQQIAADLKQVKAQALAAIDAARQLQAQGAQPAASREPRKDNDAEVFGPDLIAAIDRRAAEIAQANIARERAEFQKVITELDTRLGAVDQSLAVTAEDRFYSALSREVPDWETINTAPEFLTWLEYVDPVFRVPRKVALTTAEKQGNANAAIAVFQAFKAQSSGAGKAASASAAPASRTEELQRQVSPNARPGAPVGAGSGARVWSEREFREALDPRQRLHLGDVKAAQLKDAANKALAEGRVRWG